jgi:hypothetical protein
LHGESWCVLVPFPLLYPQGLKSLDVQISSACASAIDNLATFYFKNVVWEPESGRVPPGALVRSVKRGRGRGNKGS